MNRPGALERLVLPTGCARRGASGTYSPDLSGADANPFMGSGALHGLDDGKNWGNVQLVSHRLHGTVVSAASGAPYDDSIVLFPGTYGDTTRHARSRSASVRLDGAVPCGQLRVHGERE
jgi:hypothetical protein